MAEAHAARRQRLAARVAGSGADAALITHLTNVRYLTGLASSNAALLVFADDAAAGIGGGGVGGGGVGTGGVGAGGGDGGDGDGTGGRVAAGGVGGGADGVHGGDGGAAAAVLATDTRYAVAAERDCPDVELITERNVAASLAQLAARRGMRRVLFEAHAMTVAQHATLAGDITDIELAPLGQAVEELRVVKDEEELAAIATACRLTCAAFGQVLASIRPGVTEKQLAIALERHMVELGADEPGFATIVASGPNGAIPHHVPTGRPIALGDLVTMDLGACYDGYHADMTRTVAVGEPAGWQRDIYQLVAAAQQAGVAAAQPGAHVAAVDAAARDLIAAAGHGGHFGHGLGHGVGLQIHEAPLMHHDGTGTLGDRVPITVEPGIYVPGKGGVRIEDTLVVRAGAGPGELLTTITKELLVL